MPNGKKRKGHKMATHKRKKDCARIVIKTKSNHTFLTLT